MIYFVIQTYFMDMDEHTLKIDLRKSASANAEDRYYAAKKARQKLIGAKKALEDTRRKIAELEEKHEASVGETAPRAKKASEKRWYDKFHYFTSSDGFFVAGGKDATTNEILIKNTQTKTTSSSTQTSTALLSL